MANIDNKSGLIQQYFKPLTVSTGMLPKKRVITYSRWPANMILETGNKYKIEWIMSLQYWNVRKKRMEGHK